MSASLQSVVWVHLDAVSPEHPVFTHAPDARAVFIWDAGDLARRGWTLKRCVFLMECVEAMGADVVEGAYANVLGGFAPHPVLMADTADPHLLAAARDSGVAVTAVPGRPLTDVPATTDMGRFFRFWNKARRSVLSPTAELSAPAPRTLGPHS